MLVAGATSAMADQGSNQAADYALSLQAARGGVSGAYASAREPRIIHNGTVNVPARNDFQLQGR
jgi:hypothetical protein